MDNVNTKYVSRKEYYRNLSTVMVFLSLVFLKVFLEMLDTVNVIGKVAIILSVCCSNSFALVTEIPGNVVGM